MVRDWSWAQDALEASLLVWYRPSIQQKITLRYFQVWRLAWRRTLIAWIYVPIGVLSVLLACWGVDSLIGLSSVSFPASVALLIVLFFTLILCESILGNQRTKKIVQVIDIPVSCQDAANLGCQTHVARLGLLFAISMCFSPLPSVRVLFLKHLGAQSHPKRLRLKGYGLMILSSPSTA